MKTKPNPPCPGQGRNKLLFRLQSIVLCLFCCFQAYGQDRIEVNGKVTFQNSGLPGVSVTVKGTTLGTSTDIEGNYQLEGVDPDAVLVFSLLGFGQQEIPVEGKSVINTVMEEDVASLDQVVVIGYGTARKKDLTGAVSQVSAEKLENENPNAVADILRGNIAGLNVGFSTSAKGGAGLEVRGRATLNAGGSPLIVLDGVIYPGQLADINPNDIETIDVLKDASSAAVFGAKAASGVILITTKKGQEGKTTVNFNSNVSIATMSVNEPVYGPHEFIAWREDVMKNINAGGYDPYEFSDPRNLPSDISLDEWMAYDGSSGDPVSVWLRRLNMQPVEIENYKAGKSVNWYDMMFQNAFRQDHTISLSGRKEGVQYYMSLGYLDNEGIVVGDDFQTVRSRINIEGKVNDFLSVGMHTQFADRDESQVPVNWGLARTLSPWGSEFDEEGFYKYRPNEENSGGNHPYYAPSLTDRRQKETTLNSTLFAKVTLPFGITYRLNFTPRFEFYERYNHESSKHEDWGRDGGHVSRRQRKVYYWQVDNILNWNKTVADVHNFNVTLLANAEKYQSWDNTMTNEGFIPHDDLGYHGIKSGTNPLVESDDQYSTGDALMARLIYSFRDRYLMTASVRRDGYSAFGEANPRATFFSIAGGWVFSEEPFYNSSWLNYGKLRVSWGSNGNRDLGPGGRYAALSNLTAGPYLHVNSDGEVYQVNQLYVDKMANPNLQWERTTAFNIGLDFSLFNKVDGTLELYEMSTTDLLVQRSLPDILGFNFVWDNLGEVKNKGIELSLSSLNMSKDNFSWRTSFNFQLNRNEIAHLYGDTDENGNELDDLENEWFIGHGIDEIWNYQVDGVWQQDEAEEADKYGVSPGDFKVVDLNGDGQFTREDKVFQGFEEPRFKWTIRNEFSLFKNLDVSFMIYSYWGHKTAFNQAKNRDGFLDRTSSYVFPYWTPENPTNEWARLYSSEGASSGFSVYRDRSFIRLDNIALGYNVPHQFLERAKVESLKFFFNIRNVGVWAPNWDYWDPEWDPEVGAGPTPRTYTFGIDLTL
ncbi:TonB-linked SusC/RagA family outer membrane protein [Anseongella ginsenosidimutans]|uniref:TonB-linked SusC/RagA family outer membrane protein n=1 Tax=Anseongella ginsenosidimutans TaxID=496056 RepID=A0A4R3KYY2_9SPHI|nr:TonB-dependent receptor [Anseongella ginsenosidimutans]QEC51460.1 TonB-dependent receptor [Anseongella ginsenosidimutans]TCS89830.1 TonB-linked SusC/RagA family outer membrane protein [Anseongella ginsenosidimutans]